MSYRIERSVPNRHTGVAICLCDKDWNPLYSLHTELTVPNNPNSCGDTVVEDCRLFSVGENVGFCVTNRDNMGHGILSGLKSDTFEWIRNSVKNWTPYFDGELKWKEWPTDKNTLPGWEYGEPHGGTPMIRYGPWQVGFFQSHVMAEAKPIPSRHPSDVSREQPRRTYFGSPYAWCGDKLLLPTEPLIWPRLYGTDRRAPNNHDVVFPCGLVREGDTWTVSYGDDQECWLATFSTEEIFSVLQPS